VKKKLCKLIAATMAALLLMTGCAREAAVPEESLGADDAVPPAETPVETQPHTPPRTTYTPASDGRFTLRFNEESSLNPFSGANADNMALMGLMYEGLFTVSPTFTAEPVLCTDYEVRNEGKVYLFTLKSGVVFSDGTPLTAADVVYSITRARNAGRYMSRLAIVVSSVAVGDDKVSITLSKPDMDFPVLMDVPIVKDGTGYDNVPVGSGPYFYSQTADGSRCLYASSLYRDYGELPLRVIYLQTVSEAEIVDKFSDCTVDLLRSNAYGAAGYNLHVENDTRFYDTANLIYVGFNEKDTVMSDARMRQAISCIIDRDYICGELLGGRERPAPLVLSSLLGCYDASWESAVGYSLQRTSQIFAELGMNDYSGNGYLDYPYGEDNWRQFTVTLVVDDQSEDRLAIAENVAGSLRKVGIDTEVETLSWSAYVSALEKGDFDIYIAEARLQADFNLSSLFTEGGSLNYGKVRDAEYKTRIDAFLAAEGEAKSAAAKALCDYAAQDAAVIPLAFRRASVVTHRGAVTGVSPSQADLFRQFTGWTIKP